MIAYTQYLGTIQIGNPEKNTVCKAALSNRYNLNYFYFLNFKF